MVRNFCTDKLKKTFSGLDLVSCHNGINTLNEKHDNRIWESQCENIGINEKEDEFIKNVNLR